jgi:hypothetical protein
MRICRLKPAFRRRIACGGEPDAALRGRERQASVFDSFGGCDKFEHENN